MYIGLLARITPGRVLSIGALASSGILRTSFGMSERSSDSNARNRARRDHSLWATVLSRRPLRFAGGPDAAQDRPAHVRAGSGLAAAGGRLVVVQDDANFLALIDPGRPESARAIALPRGEDGARQFGDSRGNKHLKLDLEACVGTPDGSFVAFGSGSTPPAMLT